MPFTPSDQETDWAYSITTVPGTNTGHIRHICSLQKVQCCNFQSKLISQRNSQKVGLQTLCVMYDNFTKIFTTDIKIPEFDQKIVFML